MCWSSFSNKTGNFYLTDIKTSIVTEVNVNNGTVVKVRPRVICCESRLTYIFDQQYPQANNSSTIDNDVATICGNDFMVQ
jgi:hypothetical protein